MGLYDRARHGLCDVDLAQYPEQDRLGLDQARRRFHRRQTPACEKVQLRAKDRLLGRDPAGLLGLAFGPVAAISLRNPAFRPYLQPHQ